MTDNVWFITGSSRGLGRQIVETVLERGDKVVATARNTDSLDSLTNRYGDRLLTLSLDVSSEQQILDGLKAAHDHFGRLDVIVNNAGYANLSSVEDTSFQDFRDQIDTNLFGTIYLSKAAVPYLREQGSGHIINISSISARGGTAGFSAYNAAKAGVSGFTRALAAEVAPLGLKVSVVEPGSMPTDWSGSSMTIPTPSSPYEATVGVNAGFIASDQNVAMADLEKVAQAIITIADMNEPPVRIVLGSDAFTTAQNGTTELANEDAKWEELSRSTDRDTASV